MTEIKDDDRGIAEADTTDLRPDARRRRTDIVFRAMARNEAAERQQKTERLKRARLEAKRDGL